MHLFSEKKKLKRGKNAKSKSYFSFETLKTGFIYFSVCGLFILSRISLFFMRTYICIFTLCGLAQPLSLLYVDMYSCYVCAGCFLIKS